MHPRIRHLLAALVAPAVLIACADNPTAPADDGGDDHAHDELNVELSMSAEHVHTLSEVTYTVSVTNDHGDPVTDLAAVEVQRKAHGSDTWRGTELALAGTVYEGTYTFNSSGEYDLRVAAQRPDEADLSTVWEAPDHLQVGRAHTEVGDYRVEFESFPGHIHEGETATMKFWVFEKEKDPVTDERPPVGGLTAPEIHCQGSGPEEMHPLTEVEPGVYTAEHAFGEAGEFHAGLHFPGDMPGMGGMGGEAEFHFHIAGGH